MQLSRASRPITVTQMSRVNRTIIIRFKSSRRGRSQEELSVNSSFYHHMPGTLSRLPRSDTPQPSIGESFPDDPSSSSPLASAGPRGLVLDGAFLDYLTPAGVEGQHSEWWSLSALLMDTATERRSCSRNLIRGVRSELAGRRFPLGAPLRSARPRSTYSPVDGHTRTLRPSQVDRGDLDPLTGPQSSARTFAPARTLH